MEMGYERFKTKHESLSAIKYRKLLLEQVHDNLFIEESVKSKCCKDVYGAL